MMREDLLTAWAKGDDVKRLRGLSWNVHARRTDGHPGNNESLHAPRPLSQDTLHVGYGHMPLENHAVDDRRMA